MSQAYFYSTTQMFLQPNHCKMNTNKNKNKKQTYNHNLC